MGELRRLYGLLTRPERDAAVALLGLMVVGMLLEALGIGLIVPATAVLIEADFPAAHPRLRPLIDALGNPTQSQLVIGGMLVLVVAYVFKTIFLGFLAWRQSGFAYGVGMELSQRMLTTYLRQPFTFHLQRNSAELVRNSTREVDLVTLYCLVSVLTIGTDGLIMVGIAGLLFAVEPVGALIVAFTLGAAAWAFSRAPRARIARWSVARQFHDGLRLQHLQQGLGGAKEIVLMGREAEFLNQYRVHNVASARLLQRQATMQQLPRLGLELLAVIGLAILVITMLAQGRQLTNIAPALGLFAAAGFRLIPSANRVLMAVQSFRYGKPSINTLHDELGMAVPASRPAEAHPTLFRDELRLSAVSYAYPGATPEALTRISLVVRRGESVGFIGPSGSGKSTLVDVCLGLLTPTEGEIRVDGRPIQEGLRAWQDQIGYVPQSVYLTDDTVRRNVAFGLSDDRIDDAAVQRAIRDAQLEDFVAALPNGLETTVGERGVALSGGQRQRLGIARALYHDPAVLVLDEATSALDVETERGILKAVTALHGSKTIMIVAHRFSTVTHCDRLFRLEQGRVIAEGQPATMLRDVDAARSTTAPSVAVGQAT
jgi:ABC-type multidrug transport system fused ATPase/permease subunit